MIKTTFAPRLLASACLCGAPCRHDGGSCPVPALVELVDRGEAVAFCPEVAGGLPVPRPPCELRKGHPVTLDGIDCAEAFSTGAKAALALARRHGITVAVLKDKSPSCGGNRIYDGSFTRTLIPGRGVTAALLAANGITLFSEDNFTDF